MDFEKAYTPKEVAALLRVSIATVYEWARITTDAGGIPSYKVGGRVRIKESDLCQWLENRKRA